MFVRNLGTSALYPVRFKNEVEFELLKRGWVRLQTVDSRIPLPYVIMFLKSWMYHEAWCKENVFDWGHIHTNPNVDGFASNMRLEWRSYWPQIHPISEYRGLIAFDLTSVLAYSWPCRISQVRWNLLDLPQLKSVFRQKPHHHRMDWPLKSLSENKECKR